MATAMAMTMASIGLMDLSILDFSLCLQIIMLCLSTFIFVYKHFTRFIISRCIFSPSMYHCISLMFPKPHAHRSESGWFGKGGDRAWKCTCEIWELWDALHCHICFTYMFRTSPFGIVVHPLAPPKCQNAIRPSGDSPDLPRIRLRLASENTSD